MEFDELQLLVIQIVLGAQLVMSTDKHRLAGQIIKLDFTQETSAGHENNFWIHGEELTRDGENLQIGGEINCSKGTDGHWCHGQIRGYVYLFYAGKCPVNGEYIPGQGMTVVVRKDIGVYNYERVGEFTI
jgi:hypothetical protein